MSVNELLAELHRLHRRVADLSTEADEGPRRVKKYSAKIEHHQKQLTKAQDEIKHLKVAIHEKEVLIKANLEKAARHQEQMNTASDRKTYDALRREIDHEKQANRVIEDEILELMGQIEEKSALSPGLESALKLAQEEHRRAVEAMGGRQSDLEQQRRDAEAELKQLESTIPDDLRERYLRLKSTRGSEAISPVQGRSCEGCNTEATAQQYNDLLADRLVLCKSCGCLLFLPR